MIYHCTQCQCPLETGVVPNCIGPFSLCCVCFDMWLAVAANPFFIQAQQEMIDEMTRKQQLINGE